MDYVVQGQYVRYNVYMLLTNEQLQIELFIEDGSMNEEAITAISKRAERLINSYTDRDPLVAPTNATTRQIDTNASGVLTIPDYVGTATITTDSIGAITTTRVGVGENRYATTLTANTTYAVEARWGYVAIEAPEADRIIEAYIMIAKKLVSHILKQEGDISNESVGRLSQGFTVERDLRRMDDIRELLGKYKNIHTLIL